MKAPAAPRAALLVLLLVFGGPRSALAEQYPFCTADGPPQVGEGFRALAGVLGSRVGVAVECEHAEGATGDVQQHTSTGLLYWRRSTNTPTFTDGAEHWALRGTQSLHWLTDSADPPEDAQAHVVAVVSAPDAAAPPAAPSTPVASTQAAGAAASAGSNAGMGSVTAAAVVTFGVLVFAGLGVLLVRQRRPAGSMAGGKATRLVAATAVSSAAGGLANPAAQGAAGYLPTVPARELEAVMQDIGRNRVTEQADVVLQYDPEPMVWQASPSAIAVLTPKALKWLLIVLVGLVAGAWLGASLPGSGTSPTGRAAAAAVQWALVLLPLALMAWSLGVSYARLRATRYRATRQRLEITSGVFGQHTVTRELHELGDALIERPFHYRVFGVGNLVLAHRTKPPLVLEAITNPEGVRDLLRSAGQIEAARFDKTRWR